MSSHHVRHCYQVTFELDGRGVIMSPFEPIHIDGLVAIGARMRYASKDPAPGRGDRVSEIPLPLWTREINGHRVYEASALFPVEAEPASQERHLVKRFDFDEASRCGVKATVDYSTGFFRLYNVATQVLLVSRLVGWFACSAARAHDVRRMLSKIRYIGKAGRAGYGGVVSVSFDRSDDIDPVVRDGVALRWYPHQCGLRRVRPRPPYWNMTEVVHCLAPGERVS